MAKKHKTQPNQPPKAETNTIHVEVSILNIPIGHLTQHTTWFNHKNQKRLKTRSNQLRSALKDY